MAAPPAEAVGAGPAATPAPASAAGQGAGAGSAPARRRPRGRRSRGGQGAQASGPVAPGAARPLDAAAPAEGAAPQAAAPLPADAPAAETDPARRRRRGRRGGRRRRAHGAVAAGAAPEAQGEAPGAEAVPAADAVEPPAAGSPRGRRSRRARGAAPAPAAAVSPARNVADLAVALGIGVQEERWFRQALYHASYVNERGSPGISSNERLEFLGDAVLDLAVGQYLFERYPDMAEGDLSRLRAAVVRASTLAARGKAMGLGRFALLGKGEERSGGRRRPNFLADLFEALIGALFLDQGIGAATEFVLSALRPDLEAAAEGYQHANYKAQLQDAVQKEGQQPISYAILSMEGPEHARVWQCEVQIGGRRSGRGEGRTKKEAEQEAAREALLRGWNHAGG